MAGAKRERANEALWVGVFWGNLIGGSERVLGGARTNAGRGFPERPGGVEGVKVGKD